MDNFHALIVTPGRHVSQAQFEVWTLEILLQHNKRKIDEMLRQRPDLKPLVDIAMRGN